MSKTVKKIKTVASLEAGDCKWPIGDPRHADFHFCGAPQALGRPYCAHHWEQSFVASASRQRQPATFPGLLPPVRQAKAA
jgi:GcrA cell cycle regulator